MKLNNNQCKLVNIIWVDRGILLRIIYYILLLYDKLTKLKIIIDNSKYIDFLKTIFPKLKFYKYTKHTKRNFYFNIRKIIKKQDIIIDYLSNYDEYISTLKLRLIPWYDMNDPLIIYHYNKEYKMYINNYAKLVTEFSSCNRANFGGYIWDLVIENKILNNYINFDIDIDVYFNKKTIVKLINSFFKNNYIDVSPSFENPKIYYQIINSTSPPPPVAAAPPPVAAAAPPPVAPPVVAAPVVAAAPVAPPRALALAREAMRAAATREAAAATREAAAAEARAAAEALEARAGEAEARAGEAEAEAAEARAGEAEARAALVQEINTTTKYKQLIEIITGSMKLSAKQLEELHK